MTTQTKTNDNADLLILDKNGNPQFIQTFNAIMERIPTSVLSCNAKVLYSKLLPLFRYYKTLDEKDAVIKEIRPLLARYAGLTPKQFDTAINELIAVELVEDLTPGLRNKPHCYVIYEWEHRTDLLTEKSVEEIRKELRICNNYSAINVKLNNSAFPKGKACFPKKESDFTNSESEFPKKESDFTKGNMSKIGLDTTKLKSDSLDSEIEENEDNNETNTIITSDNFEPANAASCNEEQTPEPHKENDDVSSLPSSESVSPLSLPLASGGGKPHVLKFLEGFDITTDEFMKFANDKANLPYFKHVEADDYAKQRDLYVTYRDDGYKWPDRMTKAINRVKHNSIPEPVTNADNLY